MNAQSADASLSAKMTDSYALESFTVTLTTRMLDSLDADTEHLTEFRPALTVTAWFISAAARWGTADMTVYVDNMRAGYGRMTMCHMIADSREELLTMADTIGVARKWIQHQGTHREHFDICLAKRALAVKAGAVEVTMKELVKMTNMRKHLGRSLDPTPLPRTAPAPRRG